MVGFYSWLTQEVPIKAGIRRVVLKAIRGGTNFVDDQGDVAFDDILIEVRDCSKGENMPSSPHCKTQYITRGATRFCRMIPHLISVIV